MAVQVFHRAGDLKEAFAPARLAKRPIGLVPTMGALHLGHGSLISRSARDQRPDEGVTVVSIFVNPIQFEDRFDLDSYPQTLDSDLKLCEEAGADFVFAPSANEMYPEGFSTFVDMEGDFLTKLCGAARPGHFRGVLTVVSKLLHITQPTRAYFGEKDAQQLFVIKKMARDLGMDVQVIGCPTVRDSDGLALSSRNSRLSDKERVAARCLARAIEDGRSALAERAAHDLNSRVEAVKKSMASIIEAESLARLDYADILDADTFGDVTRGTRKALLAVAAYFGETRLIDNMSVDLDCENEADGLR
ncbi:MAG: pantoate--beta-alanine ligase [Clostridiales Family XIII bacterium]|jgi:pantoate--beta-alanine ligase|nr:pantoate--beta-alanine ligase [Clostridiales Family XIII bacterium]